MNDTTHAIVLRLAPHSEKAQMLHLYTRSQGRMQFLVYGMGSRKNRARKALLEPMSVIQIETTVRDAHALGSLRDWSAAYVPEQLHVSHSRRCVALFIAEVLYRTLTHPLTDEAMYDYLEQTVRELDTCNDPQNAHIRFLIDYAELLGFALPEEMTLANNRRDALHQLMRYYTEHIPDFTQPKSLAVLEDVFNS